MTTVEVFLRSASPADLCVAVVDSFVCAALLLSPELLPMLRMY